jgi:hypothetical protein
MPAGIDWNHAPMLPVLALITGNHGTWIEKASSRITAETKAGKDRPNSEAMRVT